MHTPLGRAPLVPPCLICFAARGSRRERQARQAGPPVCGHPGIPSGNGVARGEGRSLLEIGVCLWRGGRLSPVSGSPKHLIRATDQSPSRRPSIQQPVSQSQGCMFVSALNLCPLPATDSTATATDRQGPVRRGAQKYHADKSSRALSSAKKKKVQTKCRQSARQSARRRTNKSTQAPSSTTTEECRRGRGSASSPHP